MVWLLFWVDNAVKVCLDGGIKTTARRPCALSEAP